MSGRTDDVAALPPEVTVEAMRLNVLSTRATLHASDAWVTMDRMMRSRGGGGGHGHSHGGGGGGGHGHSHGGGGGGDHGHSHGGGGGGGSHGHSHGAH